MQKEEKKESGVLKPKEDTKHEQIKEMAEAYKKSKEENEDLIATVKQDFGDSFAKAQNSLREGDTGIIKKKKLEKSDARTDYVNTAYDHLKDRAKTLLESKTEVEGLQALGTQGLYNTTRKQIDEVVQENMENTDPEVLGRALNRNLGRPIQTLTEVPLGKLRPSKENIEDLISYTGLKGVEPNRIKSPQGMSAVINLHDEMGSLEGVPDSLLKKYGLIDRED